MPDVSVSARALGSILALGLIACGNSAAPPSEGASSSGGARGHGTAGAGPGGSGILTVGDASSAIPFDAHVERDHIALDFFTLSCAGDCAVVEAVATGGTPPYTYRWEDGSTDPIRRVCPSADSMFRVSATDRGVDSVEIRHAPRTAQATVTASVLSCPDGGSHRDAGTGRRDAGCIVPGAAPGCDDFSASLAQGKADSCGVWTYGWSSAASGFEVYDMFLSPTETDARLNPNGAGLSVWASSRFSADSFVPDLLYNPGAAPVHPQGTFTVDAAGNVLRPGRGGEASVVRWTARVAGTYDLAATFTAKGAYLGSAPTTAEVRIRHQGVDVDVGRINYFPGDLTFSFQNTITVKAAGEAVDFSVSSWDPDTAADATALLATICEASPAN